MSVITRQCPYLSPEADQPTMHRAPNLQRIAPFAQHGKTYGLWRDLREFWQDLRSVFLPDDLSLNRVDLLVPKEFCVPSQNLSGK